MLSRVSVSLGSPARQNRASVIFLCYALEICVKDFRERESEKWMKEFEFKEGYTTTCTVNTHTHTQLL